MTLNSAVLSDAMNARERATNALVALTQRGIKTDADRNKETELLNDIARYDAVVSAEVRRGAAFEFSRENGGRIYMPTDGTQRRELGDVKLLGTKLSDVGNDMWSTRSADGVEDTGGHAFADVMLSSAPNGSKLIGRVNAFRFAKTRGFVPIAPVIEAELVARNAAMTDAAVTTAVGSFDTVKPSAYTVLDRDELQDFPAAEATINAALLGAIGRKFDGVIVAGGTDGDITVPGILDAGVTTEATTAGTVVIGDVLDAVARIEDASANPSALLMSPASRAKFLAANVANGSILDRLPEIITIGGGAIANGVFVVVDLASVAVSLRQDMELFKSIDAPQLWGADKVALAARARLSGVVLGDAAHAQVVS